MTTAVELLFYEYFYETVFGSLITGKDLWDYFMRISSILNQSDDRLKFLSSDAINLEISFIGSFLWLVKLKLDIAHITSVKRCL